MRKTTKSADTENKIAVDLPGAMAMLSVGRSTAEKIGKEAGAAVKIGNRKLYVVSKLRDYMDSLAASGCEE